MILNMDAQYIIKRLQEQRKNGELLDYEIVTSDGKVFKVHKSYLVSVMPKFAPTLMESKTNHMTLSDITSTGLAPVLDYMYGEHNINIDGNNIADILNAASLLHVTGVTRLCEKRLMDIVEETNILDYRKLCIKFALKESIYNLDVILTCSGIVYKLLDVGVENEPLVKDIEEELFVKLLKQTPLKSVNKFECMCRYMEAKKNITIPASQLYNYAFFLYCFLLSDEEKREFSSRSELSSLEWFAKIQSESSEYLSVPMHQQVSKQSEQYDVQQGVEVLVDVEPNCNFLGVTMSSANVNGIFAPRRLCLHPGVEDLKEQESILTEYKLTYKHFKQGELDKTTVVNNYLLLTQIGGLCFLFNPRNLSLEQVGSLPSNYSCYCLLSHGKHLLAIGGMLDEGVSTDCIKKFDFDNNEWKDFAKLPVKVLSLIGCVHKGLMYVSGGLTLQPGVGPMRNACAFICIDPTTGSVSRLPDLPASGGSLALLLSFNNFICARPFSQERNCINKYNPDTKAWNVVADDDLWIMEILTRIPDGSKCSYFSDNAGAICKLERLGEVDMPPKPVCNLQRKTSPSLCSLTLPTIARAHLKDKVL